MKSRVKYSEMSCWWVIGMLLVASPAIAASEKSGETLPQLFSRIQHLEPAVVQGGNQNPVCLTLDVDLAAAPLMEVVEEVEKPAQVLAMVNNNVAEGWSWRPGSNPAEQDYYEFKFLPLGSVLESRGEYQAEDQIGEPQTMRIVWRYDYFFAFDNLYDFYPRRLADDAGFVLHKAPPVAGAGNPVGVRAQLCLTEPVTSESTTFWKATHGKPVDLTLKKRYFVGKLKQLEFYDVTTGESLERVATH